MPLVKKGKSKSEKAAGDVTVDEAGNILDPTSVLEGGTTDTKKKKKKKKMTKGEKELARLEKAAEILRTSGDKYIQFVDTVDRWVVKNGTKAIQLFRRFDADGDGFLSYEEFKSGMFDISAPLNAIELHLLCKLLDKDSNNVIDYREFNAGLTFVREGDDSHFPDGRSREDGFLITSQRQFEHCVCCKMALWHPYKDPFPKYLDINFKLATFDNAKTHPGHFKSKVCTSVTVHGLLEIIRDTVQVASTKLGLFTDKDRSEEAMLPDNKTLEELGFPGGSREKPYEITLYYDYLVEFSDCPLLMCDNFLREYKVDI